MPWILVVLCVFFLTEELTAQNARVEQPPLQRLRAQLRDGGPRAQWRAVRGFVGMGKAAVPTLVRLMEAVDAGERPRASARLACEALQQLGAQAVAALPTAMKMFKGGSPEQTMLALELLAIVGPHDPGSIDDCKETVFQMREGRGRIAARTGKARPSQIPMYAAVDCLIRLSEDREASVDDLIAHIEGDSSAHIEMGLERLAGFKNEELKKARDAISTTLLRARTRLTRFKLGGRRWGWSGSTPSRNGDKIRIKAAQLLSRIGGTTDLEERRAIHVALVRHGDPAVRQRSALSLGGLGADAGSEGVAALITGTGDVDKLVAWDAITALGMIGKSAKDALPVLRGLARSDDKARAVRAKSAIRRIESELGGDRVGR